jgi:CHASE3 domain sensor protein
LNRLEEIKQDIAIKLEKTAKLNLDNAETTKELDSMKEAHQLMIDSLKLQMETFNRELQQIRNTRYEKTRKPDPGIRIVESLADPTVES